METEVPLPAFNYLPPHINKEWCADHHYHDSPLNTRHRNTTSQLFMEGAVFGALKNRRRDTGALRLSVYIFRWPFFNVFIWHGPTSKSPIKTGIVIMPIPICFSSF